MGLLLLEDEQNLLAFFLVSFLFGEFLRIKVEFSSFQNVTISSTDLSRSSGNDGKKSS
jgi:hypothetical protein